MAVEEIASADDDTAELPTNSVSSKSLLLQGSKSLLLRIHARRRRATRFVSSIDTIPRCHYIISTDTCQASLIPEWGPTTFFLNGATIEPEEKATLERRGVAVEPEPVEGLVGEGTSLSAVRLANGTERPLDALFIGPANRLNSDILEQLGCTIEQGPLGSVVTVNVMKATNVPDVYAAGDITRVGHTITFACADGVMAALAIHRSPAFGAQ